MGMAALARIVRVVFRKYGGAAARPTREKILLAVLLPCVDCIGFDEDIYTAFFSCTPGQCAMLHATVQQLCQWFVAPLCGCGQVPWIVRRAQCAAFAWCSSTSRSTMTPRRTLQACSGYAW